MKRLCCHACGAPLENDEVAFNLHLNGRGLSRFMCLGCLGLRYGFSTENMRLKTEMLKQSGCEFFAQTYLDEDAL